MKSPMGGLVQDYITNIFTHSSTICHYKIMLISRKQLINWIIGAAPSVHICTNQDESRSFDTEGLSSFYTKIFHYWMRIIWERIFCLIFYFVVVEQFRSILYYESQIQNSNAKSKQLRYSKNWHTYISLSYLK